MSATVREIRAWLEKLPAETTVGIDDGGLTLQSVQYPQVCLEIGGLPEEA